MSRARSNTMDHTTRREDLHLLKDNALGHARATEGVGLHVGHGVRLVVFLTRPSLIATMGDELTSSAKTSRLSVRRRWMSAKASITTDSKN